MPINDGNSDGPKSRLTAEQVEIARLKADLEHQRLLVAELQHRAKNALAIVQALITSTLTDDTSIEQARELLSDRIVAMGRANALLGSAEGMPVQIDDAVRNAFAHLGQFEGRITISGPALAIGPKAAIAIAMAFHELETNAIKYGALSNDTGTIDVEWSIVESGPSLCLFWNERGGPLVQEPTRKGFGTRLVSTATARSLQGKAELCFMPTGVTWSMTTPLSAAQERSLDPALNGMDHDLDY
ncbi:HWE histidine kinase domain-containing protein [Sphingobium xenophagum]|uniref:HWE histidine kinase domain-containing protein n=1 Tax=Sphingobium xenophagum TaxID=121428 RepID=UPI000376EDE6|nr:HWE histidine kinase domain-containing protein [Sphingobium xenophagum]